MLLPTSADISYLAFVGLYMVALAVSLLSLVPGGLGVFESILVLLLPGVPAPQLLGALLAYRLVYYALPFGLAVLLLSAHEFQRQRARLIEVRTWTQRSLDFVVPQAVALLVVGAGFLLLLSGTTPGTASRLAALARFLPLPIVELSHLAGSAVGVLLLILARGLMRRLDGAWHVTMALLGVGIVASLLKGLDYEEALLLLAAMLPLWWTREQFYRKSSLLAESLSPAWLASASIAIGASIWVGLLAYRHVPYASELWWQFELDGHAPRMLRASLLAVVMLGAFAALRLLAPARTAPARPSAADLDRAETHHPRLPGHVRKSGAAGGQVTAVQRLRQVVPDVRHRSPQLGRDGRSGRSCGGAGGSRLALPRPGGPRRRPERLLPGVSGKPAALRRCGTRAQQIR